MNPWHLAWIIPATAAGTCAALYVALAVWAYREWNIH